MIQFQIIPDSEQLFSRLKQDITGSLTDVNELEVLREVNIDSSSIISIVDVNIISKLLIHDYTECGVNSTTAVGNILKFLNVIDDHIKDNKTLIHLSSTKIRDILSTKKHLAYLKVLRDLNILAKVPYEDGSFYTPGQKNIRYRIMNDYINSKNYCMVIRTISKTNVKKDFKIKLPARFEKTISLSRIDYRSYLTAEITNYLADDNVTIEKLKWRLNQAFALLNKRYTVKGTKVDRVYHSFSNLSKIARNHLRSPNGQSFIEVDITNSQPTFLIAYLKSKGFKLDEDYVKDTEEGNIYERFIGLKGQYMWFNSNTNKKSLKQVIIADRGDAKIEFYNAVLFHFKGDHPLNQQFKKLYPLTWKILKDIHSGDNSLASRLQNFESDMIHSVNIKSSKYYFTLHDAVYFTDVIDRQDIKDQIKQQFNNLGVTVKLN